MRLLTLKWITSLLLVALAGGGFWGLGRMGQAQVTSPGARLNAPRQLDAEERSNVDLFRRAASSVVNICTKTAVARRTGEVTLSLEAISTGAGSGFLWDSQGHVVTNYHVVREADAVQVTLGDGSVRDADLVGTAPEFDIAVLRIDSLRQALAPLAVGRSHDLEVGQKVYAIGNPFGLDHTLTTGIISGLGRQIESQAGQAIEDVIQTDAAINPGNSGGPLLDSQGELIGMNTAILSPSGASAGVGFAVPVNTIKSAVPELIRFGKIVQPGLGVTLAPQEIVERVGVEGALILRVADDSPAAEAGLQPTRFGDDGNIVLGDVIMSVDGERTDTAEILLQKLRTYKVGDVVTVGVNRGDGFSRVRVRLRAL